MDALTIDNLSHHYGNMPILDAISFSIEQGEFVCLAGPSGCGKTTLLRLIAGLIPLQDGKIISGNRMLAASGLHVPPNEREIGFVFQDASLFPHLTVIENVMFGLQHFNAAARKEHAEDMLEQVCLLARKDDYPHALSGGQQQRVALVRALAPQPHIMLLDEPFTNLDRELRRRIRDETLQLLKSNNVASIMVTHEPYEAMVMADRIILLDDDGHVHQVGSPDELYHEPIDSFSALYFGDTNHFEITLEAGIATTPLGELDFKNDKTGNALMIVRPEDIFISYDGQGVKGTIERTKCVGAECDVTIKLDNGQRLLIRPRGNYHGMPGDSINLHTTADQCYLFNQ